MLELSDEFTRDLRQLEELPAAVRTQLLEALGNIEPSFELEDAIYEALAALPDSGQVGNIVNAIIALHYAFANSPKKRTQQDFALEIGKSAKRQLGDTVSGEFESSLANIIQQVLGVPKLRLGYKASSLLLDEERGFSAARIITDIRPVFGDNVRQPDLAAAFIVHTLRIAYRGPDRGEFFVSLSTRDLEVLREVVGRALDKAAGLGVALPKLITTILEPK